MQVESEIKNILNEGRNADKIADKICSFMSWDRKELIKAIKKHGCSTKESQENILAEFWGKPKRKWN